MKSFIYITFLFVCINAQDRQEGLSELGQVDELLNNLLNQINNEEDGIERPCLYLDKDCIRNWLYEHSHCTRVYGSVPEPLYRIQASQQLPSSNFSVTAIDLLYSGLNGRIEEFYVNRKTDQVVLAVEFRDINYYTNNSLYIFYRNSKEPLFTKDTYNVTYRSLVVTATIPRVNNLRYDRSQHFTYSNLPVVQFTVGPTTFTYNDPIVQRVALSIIADQPTSIRSVILSEGLFLMANFIQYTMCDFGLKVI